MLKSFGLNSMPLLGKLLVSAIDRNLATGTHSRHASQWCKVAFPQRHEKGVIIFYLCFYSGGY